MDQDDTHRYLSWSDLRDQTYIITTFASNQGVTGTPPRIALHAAIDMHDSVMGAFSLVWRVG
jgi:hypothetical protein